MSVETLPTENQRQKEFVKKFRISKKCGKIVEDNIHVIEI
jgi:hypothetical protein